MIKLTIRNITAHKRRFLATCLAVILGVAFLTATLALGDTMRAGFRTQIAQGIGDTAVAVRSTTRLNADDQTGQTGLVDASLVDQLRTVDGVADAEPSVQGAAQLIGHDRTPIGGDGPPTVGVNWIPTGPLNAFHIVDGRAPAAAGEVAIDRRSADLGSLHVGDQTVVRAPDPVPVTVVGIVAFGDQDTLGGATVTFFTTEQASELLLGQPGKLTSVSLTADARRERRRARRPRPGHAAGRHRSGHRGDVARRVPARGRHRLPRLLPRPAAGLRRGGAARGDVQHLQHAVDRRRPAHPRIGAACGRSAPRAARCCAR